MIFGYSEPVVVAIILFAAVVIVYALPYMQKKKSLLDYSNYNVKDSNAYWHYAGTGPAPGYMNVKLAKNPITHNNGHATVHLEGLPNPLIDVVIDENDKNCNCVIKRTADALFGIRIDILCNIDGNSCKHEWDNVYVQNWLQYRNKMMDAAKSEVLRSGLQSKELIDELKESPSMTTSNFSESMR
jgi:hypothetical protein